MIKASAIIAIIAALGLTGTSDHDEAVSQYEHYCEMVVEYSQPNYKGIDCDDQ